MQPTNQPPAEPVLPHHWILVVDDEATVGHMIEQALATERLEVVHAKNGSDALRVIEQRATEPLLVLLDVLMPGMDGLTLARKVSPRLHRSKIVIISGHLTDLSWWPADLRELVFLAKPFRIHELNTLVAIARKEYDRES